MTTDVSAVARRIAVTGVVQGVGYRPFVHRLATRHGLSGWVRNVAGTVEIHVEGEARHVADFETALRIEAPPVSRIEGVCAAATSPLGTEGFSITESADAGGHRPVPAASKRR